MIETSADKSSAAPQQSTASSGAEKSPATNIPLTTIGTVIWALGAVVFLAWHFIGHLRYRRRLMHQSSPCTDEQIISAMKELNGRLPIRTMKGIEPMVMGCLKPILLLPEGEYADGEMRFILQHELAHYRRCHLWIKLLLLCVNGIHWFNPMVYLMVRWTDSDLEQACDDAVIHSAPLAVKKAYSEAILSAVSRNRTPALSTCFNGGKQTLERRFRNIFGSRKKNALPLMVIVMAAVLSAGLISCSIEKTESSPPIKEGSLPVVQTDTPEASAYTSVTVHFDDQDWFSSSGEEITYKNPGSGADAIASNMVIKGAVEPIDPFRVEFQLPAGWTVRQPEEGEATYAAMTFQPMNLYDKTGTFVGTIGFNRFTVEQAEIHSGDEPDGKWGPENYTGIYWQIMTGYYSWDNDYTIVRDIDGGSATCRVRYDDRMTMVDETAYNAGILAYSSSLMRWIGIEVVDGALTDEQLIHLAASIEFSPEQRKETNPPAPSNAVPAGYLPTIMGFSYDEQPGSGSIYNITLATPEGWTLSAPGDLVYNSLMEPVFSVINGEGQYIATIFRGSYTPVPEAEGQWNSFRAVYSDIMMGSGYFWGGAYTPVTRTDTGETAIDEVYYADWFIEEDKPLCHKGILSYDSRYLEYIAIEFISDEIDDEIIRTIAESITFVQK